MKLLQGPNRATKAPLCKGQLFSEKKPFFRSENKRILNIGQQQAFSPCSRTRVIDHLLYTTTRQKALLVGNPRSVSAVLMNKHLFLAGSGCELAQWAPLYLGNDFDQLIFSELCSLFWYSMTVDYVDAHFSKKLVLYCNISFRWWNKKLSLLLRFRFCAGSFIFLDYRASLSGWAFPKLKVSNLENLGR